MGRRKGPDGEKSVKRKPVAVEEEEAPSEEPPAPPGLEISQGGFQDKRKYRLDDETASYYKEIAKVLSSEEAQDAEQRAMLVSNALGEALGKELALAMDPDCSRIVQTLIKAAAPDEVLAYLSAVSSGGRIAVLVTNPFGSHVVEDLLRALSFALAGSPPPPQGFNTRLRTALEPLCTSLSENVYDLAAHRSASPVLRTVLKMLSGQELESSVTQAKGGGLKGKVSGGAGAHQGKAAAAAGADAPGADAQAKPPPRFAKLLRAFIEKCFEGLEASREYWEFTADPAGCAFLQGMASAATYPGGPEAVLPRLLGAPVLDDPAEDGEHFALVSPTDMRTLLQDRCGSRLAEVVIREAPPPLRREIYRRFLHGSLPNLAAHGAANFVVQAYVAELSDEAEVEEVLEELGPSLGELLATSRGGVVAALVAAAARLPACHKAGAKALARGVMTRFGGAPPKAAAAADADDEGAKDKDKEKEKDNTAYVGVLVPSLLRLGGGAGLTRKGFSVLGCVILSSVLRLPAAASQQFADSLAALPSEELAAAASDPSASRSLEAFLQGAAPVGLKRKCMLALTGKWGALGVDGVRTESGLDAAPQCSSIGLPSHTLAAPRTLFACVGAHVVESAYNAADSRGREIIVSEIADNETAVASTRHGPVLLGKLGASQYKRDPAAWRKSAASVATVRAAFADILTDSGAKPGGGAAEGAAGKGKKSKVGAVKPAGPAASTSDDDEEEEKVEKRSGRDASGPASASGRGNDSAGEGGGKLDKKKKKNRAPPAGGDGLGGARVDAVFELLGLGTDFGGEGRGGGAGAAGQRQQKEDKAQKRARGEDAKDAAASDGGSTKKKKRKAAAAAE